MEDSFSFAEKERTEINGVVKVLDVQGVEVGEVPVPHGQTDVNDYTQTIYLASGDSFKKIDPDIGETKVTITQINLIETESADDDWYEVEVEHKPIVDNDADPNITRRPVIQTQSIRSFAQRAVNYEPLENAGQKPEYRTEDVDIVAETKR